LTASAPGGGRFVVLEGVEGAGKTTQVARLAEWMGARGVPHVVAREPGGTPVGEAIRSVVLSRVDLEVPPVTELFLILAARAAFVRDVVRPALESGRVVVADRYELSTLAYQGYGRALDLEQVRRANHLATGGLRPDVCLVLDVPVDVGTGRQREGGKRADRMESEGSAFLERVREGYLGEAERDDRIVVVDGLGTPDDVHGRVVDALGPLLGGAETFPHRGA
jgi:dTMP kinase